MKLQYQIDGFSSDESSSNESSSNKFSSDEKKGKKAQKELPHKLVLPVFRSKDRDYLYTVQGTGSLSTEKCQHCCIQEQKRQHQAVNLS